MGDLVYMREKDQVNIRESYGTEIIEVRVHYDSCDDVIGYVYGDFYGKTWKVFEEYAKSLGGELSDSVIENDDKYETFRSLLNEEN